MATQAHPRLLATALALASPCVAQAQSQPLEVEKLEITGSRVKRADVEGALPVTVITLAPVPVCVTAEFVPAVVTSDLTKIVELPPCWAMNPAACGPGPYP